MARLTIQDFACDLILKNPAMSTERILELVKEHFPGCNTGPNSIAWYRSGLKTGRLPSAAAIDSPAAGAQARSGKPADPDSGWPDFGQLKAEDHLRIAEITTRHICFLHPDIVRAVVDDNKLRREDWSRRLQARKIDPSLYLWENSACTFPGIRRYAGSEEIAIFRKQKQSSSPTVDAVRIDDNTFPKQIWSFVFRGRKFANSGPLNYSLAHIFDHKTYKNRAKQEFDSNDSVISSFSGLYTSISGIVYMPTGLMRPTDFSFPLRNLIQRRAEDLYGDFCKLLPPPLTVRAEVPAEWSLANFSWRDPVGTTDHMPSFLQYRRETMDALI